MAPDPTPVLTPFFSNFKDAKKIFLFSYNLLVCTLSSVLIIILNFLLKFCITILFCKPYFSLKESGSGSISLTNGSGSGRPKNMRILRIWIRIPCTGSHRNEIASKNSVIKMTVPESVEGDAE
jgi:hypothetical protein